MATPTPPEEPLFEIIRPLPMIANGRMLGWAPEPPIHVERAERLGWTNCWLEVGGSILSGAPNMREWWGLKPHEVGGSTGTGRIPTYDFCSCPYCMERPLRGPATILIAR